MLALIFLFVVAVEAQEKRIRLRNEVITTPAPAKLPPARQGLVSEPPVSGLYLVQFNEAISPAGREQLRAIGVALLRYVPDDAFVARLDNVDLSQLRALPFVRWAGAYRADHKIHSALRAVGPVQRADDRQAVSVLFSTAAQPAEIAEALRQFQGVPRQARGRFGDVLRGSVERGRLQILAGSPAVLWIEPAPKIRLFDEVAADIVAGDGGTHTTFTQAEGYDGAGVTVAVADSGLHTGAAATMHPDLFGRVSAFLFYGANLTDAADEHSHGTHCAGIIAGNGATGEVDEGDALYGLGVAPGANIVAQRIFDGAGNYELTDEFEVLTHDAVRAGADIGSNSWGDDTHGRYDISAMQFDALVRDADADAPGDQPYILEFSAGNAGPGSQTIGSPAVAKNVIATGAAQNNRFDFFIYAEGQDAMADFSSRGPCEDGRIKPDVVAPGTWIASLRSPLGDDNNAWAEISQNYLYQGGTSQAGPQVSGAAAVFVQYYRDNYGPTPSPAMVKAALINSAVDMDDEVETGPAPNMDEGWGRVDLTEIIGSPRVYDFVDQTDLLTNSQTFERRVVIATTNEPLKITLVYTDVPGFPATIPALVNDLDLEVIAPDGRVYRGNQFLDGESVPDALAADNINNVEAVHLFVPLPGEYTVRVRARKVVTDARRDTPIRVDQDFALVISGDMPSSGAGSVFFDRSAYTVPGRIGIKVIDYTQAGVDTVGVLLQSTTESNAEVVTLQEVGASGVFTGSVATATGAAVGDGRLQITHGDLIQVRYSDGAGLFRYANAAGDLVPPVITSVATASQFGQTLVTWITDEPANSIVRFNTNATLLRSATNSSLVIEHAVELTNLVAGLTNRYLVISTDAAGNTATNNNGGVLFDFVAVPAATVLLVDAYVADPDNNSPAIPLAAYTNALNQTGVSYDVWRVATRGSPSLANLGNHRAVMWRINDSFYRSSDSLTAGQQTVIQQYLNAGGAFFMASMDLLTRLGDVPFRSNVLHVAEFLVNPDPIGICTDCDEDVGVPGIEGIDTDPVTSGISAELDYLEYPDFFGFFGPDFGDTFTPALTAAPLLFSTLNGKPCGMKFPRTGQDSAGRVAFLSFPLDTMPESAPDPNNRANLLRNILSFLVPGVNGLGTIALDNSEYPVPGGVTVEVADSDRVALGHATVTFYSDTEPGGRTLTLNAVLPSGLFRGVMPLVPATSAPANGRLRVSDGDLIWAEYFDASGNGIVRASALVDAQFPIIANVTNVAGYEDAFVTWTTSEDTDALVQFGDSTFLGRTAYRSELDTSHSVQLPRLQPDRRYYYRVVSRDLAGNVVVDDNGGEFYSFRTRRPLYPPLTEHFDSGTNGWTVFDGEETQSGWTLGAPNNLWESAAVSPPNAWGSVLNFGFLDGADTFLVSPAIDLTSAATARLRFWHSYNFIPQGDDIWEYGQLILVTNNVAVELAYYEDDAASWYEEEINLTPFVGQVVYLAWYYSLFSVDRALRAGWLVDDVSITASNFTSGTIRISNNLAQADFVLSGSLNRTGQGTFTLITNAPVGPYSIAFNPVPFYQTPAAQSNTLVGGATLSFAGDYTFADVNHNGISDAWEEEFFGEVAPGRTRLSDSDGDGFTDFAEFMAGTDPTLPDSHLELAEPTVPAPGSLRLEWSSVPGREYRVLGSRDAVSWTPITGWTRAAVATVSHTLPAPTPNAPNLFRVEVRP